MKRIVYVSIMVVLAAVMAAPTCFAQASLGDAARQQRKDKSSEPAPKKVYDNDNLPAQEHINVVGTRPVAETTPRPNGDTAKPEENANPENDSAKTDDATQNTDDKKSTKIAVDPEKPEEDRDKLNAQWQKKIADQKDTIKLLERESDVLQREYRLRAAAMYADVGNRLRNSNSWDKEDKDYKNKIQAKQKELDLAKQQLSDLQDQARKAGVPPGMRE